MQSQPSALTATVIHNGVYGLEKMFHDSAKVRYRYEPVTRDFAPDLSQTDLLIVPNGSDHVAMAKIKDAVSAHLARGKALIVLDGWFTDWVPGSQWVHDNSKKTIDVRYHVGTDRYGLFDGVDQDHLNFNHGISGWWACGYIDAAPEADVLYADTWDRPVIVLDEKTTPGLMLMTASGPLGDFVPDETLPDHGEAAAEARKERTHNTVGDLPGAGREVDGLTALYRNMIALVHDKLKKRSAGAGWVAQSCSRAHPPRTPLLLRTFPFLPSSSLAMQRIGLIFNGVWSQYAFATAPKYREHYELVYVHDLSAERIAHLDALVVPFQSDHQALDRQREALYGFLAEGKKIVVFGDSQPPWLDAKWDDRPVNNYWWVEDPTSPPVAETDFEHPLFKGLSKRHACWHIHGIYTQIPEHAQVLQANPQGEPITWLTHAYGGTLLASTLDPIVEHGIQQIRHLDHFCDQLTDWLIGERPEGAFEVPKAAYGAEAILA